ncbi:MYXO-CTERM sorting domain-containing protein [Nonomuraea sp. NPDC050451]
MIVPSPSSHPAGRLALGLLGLVLGRRRRDDQV